MWCRCTYKSFCLFILQDINMVIHFYYLVRLVKFTCLCELSIGTIYIEFSSTQEPPKGLLVQFYARLLPGNIHQSSVVGDTIVIVCASIIRRVEQSRCTAFILKLPKRLHFRGHLSGFIIAMSRHGFFNWISLRNCHFECCGTAKARMDTILNIASSLLAQVDDVVTTSMWKVTCLLQCTIPRNSDCQDASNTAFGRISSEAEKLPLN